MSVIVGIDPGEHLCGMAAIEPAPGGRVRVAWARMVESTPEALLDALRGARTACVALEWVEGAVYTPARSRALLAAHGVAGEASGVAYCLGVPVMRCGRPTWLAELVGAVPRVIRRRGESDEALTARRKATPKADRLVRERLPELADGVPRSPHLRDAVGVAIWVSRRVWKVGKK